jgi:hypothetical protein
MSKKIILEFEASDWLFCRWVINSFQWAIHQSYLEGSIRRLQADKLSKDLHEQARRQVNKIYEDAYDT